MSTAAVRARLGLETLTPDLAGLRAFYRAWCLAVPFDNLRKMNAMFREPEAPLPPVEADGFFAAWLEQGVGGTCWPHAEALYTMLIALGFDARRATGSMYDMGEPNHATTLVQLEEGSTWLLDNAFLTMEPLRIDAEAPSLLTHPVHYAEVEIDGDQVIVHGTLPPMPHIFFRLISRDVPFSEYAERWALARATGPFMTRGHFRRNEPDRILTVRGGMFFVRDSAGLKTEQLDGESLQARLQETMGVHPAFVAEWAASGALESSLAPPSPMPEPPVRIPPSKR